MKRENLLKYLLNSIVEKREQFSQLSFIIGIGGINYSGKSELSNELLTLLKNRGIPSDRVSLDDFYHIRAVRYDAKVKPFEQYYYHYYDIELFKHTILEPVYQDGELNFSDYVLNIKTNNLKKQLKVSIPKGGILICEGIFLFKNSLKNYYNYKIDLKISDTELIKRIEKHNIDKLEQYKTMFIPGYDLYETINNPTKNADIVIDNSDLINPIIVKS